VGKVNRKPMDYQKADIKKLKEWFRRFAENECKGVSPLYYSLSNKIAEDDELIKVASFCKQRQPMPNLFLASIHYLLLKSPKQELSEYFPSINKNFNVLSNKFKEHEINIIDIGTSAGLTLNLDKYEYLYNNKYFIGKSIK